MGIAENIKLYDAATRTAIYVEDVKNWQASRFVPVINELAEQINKALDKIPNGTFEGMSKSEFNKVLADLIKSSNKTLNAYERELLKQLFEFMQSNLKVSRRVWASIARELDGEDFKTLSEEAALAFILGFKRRGVKSAYGKAAVTGADAKLWAAIKQTPIYATGSLLLPFVKQFINTSKAGIERSFIKAWAGRQSVSETKAELLGGGIKQGSGSLLRKMYLQNTAVSNTAIGHVGNISNSGVQSSLFVGYAWSSVLDERTTNICIGLDGQIFKYGEGPLPPAHINCRSKVDPYATKNDIPEETFYQWVARQPATVQNDVLGQANGVAFRAGHLKPTDLSKYRSTRKLSLSEYERKVDEILTR